MTNSDSAQDQVTFQQFAEEWLREFSESNLSPIEKGRGFAVKLVTAWLDVNPDDEDFVLCDGSGDGGIDVAYLHRADTTDLDDGQSEEGNTWYLFQSKYGSAYQGQDTLYTEGLKIITTLTETNLNLSEHTEQLVGRLKNFLRTSSPPDKLVVVFATTHPIKESDRPALNRLRDLGRQAFPGLFDVEDISVQTIFEKEPEEPLAPVVELEVKGDFVEPSSGVKVGTIRLTSLYDFLKGYRDKTGDIDRLYEKNVRQFLGSRTKFNKGIAETLENRPDMFGVYNNGVTIVVRDFVSRVGSDVILLRDPYVVNGCQTTKSIWNVFQQKLDSGSSSEDSESEIWRTRAAAGVVVTKIVKGEGVALTDVTKFTNSQNAVRPQDLLALDSSFQSWKDGMNSQYGVFLEIQRGGWERQKSFQRTHPTSDQFAEYANAFDLLKVYGAGWLKEPGHAFGRSAPFLPRGSVFVKVTVSDPIGPNDLYAAHRLQKAADGYRFGRGANIQNSRRHTRYLFYFVVCELLREILNWRSQDSSPQGVTGALLALFSPGHEEALRSLLDSAIEVVDQYLNLGNENSVYNENLFQNDLNNWFKSDRLGRGEDSTYRLNTLLGTHKFFMAQPYRGEPALRQGIADSISEGVD